MPYFFDTYALFEITDRNENYRRYFEEEIITSTLNLAELFYGFLKEGKDSLIPGWKGKIKKLVSIIDADTVTAAVTFKFHNKHKPYSFIDCLGYCLAKKLSLRFLTGDKEFKGMDNVEFVGKGI